MPLDRPMGDDVLAAGAAHGGRPRAVGQQFQHAVGHPLRSRRRDQVARPPVEHRLGHRAHAGGHHRLLAGHRLQQTERVGLHVRGQQQHVHQRQHLGHVASACPGNARPRRFPGFVGRAFEAVRAAARRRPPGTAPPAASGGPPRPRRGTSRGSSPAAAPPRCRPPASPGPSSNSRSQRPVGPAGVEPLHVHAVRDHANLRRRATLVRGQVASRAARPRQ